MSTERQLTWKVVPYEATKEMLVAMDDCARECYHTNLPAGIAASVYYAAMDAAPTPSNQVGHPARVNDGVAQGSAAGGSVADADMQHPASGLSCPDGNDALPAGSRSAAVREEGPVLGVENHGACYSGPGGSQDRQAMEMAMAALDPRPGMPHPEEEWLVQCAIAALRARLDQPMQEGERELPPLPEPRAWMMEWSQHSPSFTCDKSDYVSWYAGKASYPDNLKDLFTADQMRAYARAALESQGTAPLEQPQRDLALPAVPDGWTVKDAAYVAECLEGAHGDGMRVGSTDAGARFIRAVLAAPLEQPQQPNVHSTPCVESASTAPSPGSRRPEGDWLGDWEPGGVECENCGCIFIGAEYRPKCRVCDAAPGTGADTGRHRSNVQDLTASARLSQLEALLEKAREALDTQTHWLNRESTDVIAAIDAALGKEKQ